MSRKSSKLRKRVTSSTTMDSASEKKARIMLGK